MKILVTGAAGFIGFHLTKRLLTGGHEVIGIDNFNDYYDPRLKELRVKQLQNEHFKLLRFDISDKMKLQGAFLEFQPEVVINLAAQAGVRYSIKNPDIYVQSNIVGFLNVLECCRHAVNKPALLYASSSSVYGGNKEMPFRETDKVDTPISLYAATKKSNELMAHCYSHLYNMQCIGFRFFTVYGPWGRPDMAYFLFAEALTAGKPIKVFNNGEMQRDFTYVDDIVDGLVRCITNTDKLPQYDIFNIGNCRSEKLMDFINVVASSLGIKNPQMEFLPMQDGDVPATYASVDRLHNVIGYNPTTPITVGIPKFAQWYVDWKNEKY